MRLRHQGCHRSEISHQGNQTPSKGVSEEEGKGRLPPKKTGKCGNFSQVEDPPPPCLGMTRLFEKKNHGLFCILGGSPMLKTVKNGSGIRVDPPPCFFKIPTDVPNIT